MLKVWEVPELIGKHTLPATGILISERILLFHAKRTKTGSNLKLSRSVSIFHFRCLVGADYNEFPEWNA